LHATIIYDYMVTQMQIGLLALPQITHQNTRYYTFLGGKVVSWKRKKQDVVARSASSHWCG